jgi:hypothetical protein
LKIFLNLFFAAKYGKIGKNWQNARAFCQNFPIMAQKETAPKGGSFRN